MYEGYLELGGGEVLNSARALGYSKSAPCAINWLQCPPCDGIRDVLGDDEYTYANIADAPWYDAQDEVTHRFLGAHALAIDGLPDSTREADVAEGIMDGGVVGRVRRGTRRMRVRAILSAQGEDALETGFAWLSAALSPGKCITHANACGAADMQVFTACPPTRAEITAPGVLWNDPITNLATNPSFETATGGVVAGVPGPTPAQATAAQTNDTAAHGGFAIRYTLTTASAAGLPVTDFLPSTGTVYTLVGKVRPKMRDQAVAPRVRGAAGPVIVAPMGVWTPFRVTIAAGSGSIQQTGLLIAGASGHQIGDEVDIDEVALVVGQYGGPYFDGSFPDSPTSEFETLGTNVFAYEWTGAPNASTSTYATGSVVAVEDAVAYEDAVTRLVRNLHTVTCVSGPTVEQKLHRGEAWGYIVEFVLVAAVPWMFGVTKPVNLQPSLPIVVQDVPFNLMPYPSAEIESGTVVAATNYVTNPSVEAAITSWVQGGDGFKITAAQLAIERSGELASVGSYAAKLTFTAAATNTDGWMYLQHNVPLPGITPATRYSVNEWATANVESGTAVLGVIEIHAQWRNGGTLLREDIVGTQPAAGGAVTSKSILPPATTTNVTIQAVLRVTSWSTGAKIRLYADALAVTVP